MSELRTFVAVPLPQPIRARIFAAATELAEELPGVRWSRKVENLHVTVKFLGQVPEAKVAVLGAALTDAVRTLRPFRIELRRMGAFPLARHARVLWAWVDDVEEGFAALTEAVEAAAERLGYPRERRDLTGHVTVGRSKRGAVDAQAALERFSDREFGAMVVEEIWIYESVLGGEGSTYVPRARAALARSDSN